MHRRTYTKSWKKVWHHPRDGSTWTLDSLQITGDMIFEVWSRTTPAGEEEESSRNVRRRVATIKEEPEEATIKEGPEEATIKEHPEQHESQEEGLRLGVHKLVT